jgi:serine protease Do
MSKPMGIAVAAFAISLSAGIGAQAAPSAPSACVVRAPVAAEADQPGASTTPGEANRLGATHWTGGEANPVIPIKATPLAGVQICALRRGGSNDRGRKFVPLSSSSSMKQQSMQWPTARVFLLAAVLASGSLHARAADSPSAPELVARVLSAVVSISSLRTPSPVTGMTVTAAPPGNGAVERSARPRSSRGVRVLGSGFIIDPGGIIVINRHVIEGTTDILVTLQDNTLLRATLLAQADQTDIALLKVTADSPLPSVRFGDSDAVRVADQVLAIGNPLSLSGSVTQGIVSALNRDIRETPFDDFIQTDAAINHGNSGGPLFNMRGEVIGMNTAIFSPAATSGSIGLGFAIPSNDVKFVADALRNPAGMRPGTLDFRIQQVTPEIADALNMPRAEGVIVGGTTDGGGASKCGIMAGDIILRYGNVEVTDVRMLARAIARTSPGTVVNLLIWRNEEPTGIAATVQELPQAASPTAKVPALASDLVEPGWQLAPIDDSARHTFGLDRMATGVVVTQIAPDGAAAEAGLSPGDVVVQIQQEKVTGPEDVARLMALAWQQQRHYVAALVRNAEGLRWLAVSLE